MAKKQDIVKFVLPDGDADVVSWEYIENMLNTPLSEVAAAVSTGNTALTRINTRIQTWLDEQDAG